MRLCITTMARNSAGPVVRLCMATMARISPGALLGSIIRIWTVGCALRIWTIGRAMGALNGMGRRSRHPRSTVARPCGAVGRAGRRVALRLSGPAMQKDRLLVPRGVLLMQMWRRCLPLHRGLLGIRRVQPLLIRGCLLPSRWLLLPGRWRWSGHGLHSLGCLVPHGRLIPLGRLSRHVSVHKRLMLILLLLLELGG